VIAHMATLNFVTAVSIQRFTWCFYLRLSARS